MKKIKKLEKMRRRRRRRVFLNSVLLVLLLLSLSVLYLVVRDLEGQGVGPFLSAKASSTFQLGQEVRLHSTAAEERQAPDLASLVGKITAVKTEGGQTLYQIGYGADRGEELVAAADLEAVFPTYRFNQSVSLAKNVQEGIFEDGQIIGIRATGEGDQLTFTYDVTFPSLGLLSQLGEEEFSRVIALELKETNSAAENNQLIRQALEEARENPATRIEFPSGRFLIGSQTPEEDYQVLASRVELLGAETTLVVDGSARWFGLATGPAATDGVSNFSMTGFTVEAQDLAKGGQFIIMANHGQNWLIKNNRFTMVHQLSSHVFDLGGVQTATFTGNTFEGYAPELTEVTEMGQYSVHNIISEAIQFDASSNNGGWDGGMLKAIDANYDAYNPEQIFSHQITVTDNAFIPYWSEDGRLVAYGASLGQHSSDVGFVTIVGNVFSSTLSSRFRDQAPASEAWLFEPIHLQSEYSNAIYANHFE